MDYFRFRLTGPIALHVLPSFTTEPSTPSRGKTHPPSPPTSSLMIVRAQLVLRVCSLLPTTDARLLGCDFHHGDLS